MLKLFAGLGLVHKVKNCHLGLENDAHGMRPRRAFSSPRSQFFSMQTSQSSNNITIFVYWLLIYPLDSTIHSLNNGHFPSMDCLDCMKEDKF